MQWAPSRRRVLATLSSATAAGLIGGARGMAQEAPPETTTVRLAKIPGICIAPQYVAEELLRSEGFTNVQYVELSVNVYAGFTAGTIDISMAFIAPYIIQLDAGLPLVLLGGARGMFRVVRDRAHKGGSRPQGEDGGHSRTGIGTPCLRRRHGVARGH